MGIREDLKSMGEDIDDLRKAFDGVKDDDYLFALSVAEIKCVLACLMSAPDYVREQHGCIMDVERALMEGLREARSGSSEN